MAGGRIGGLSCTYHRRRTSFSSFLKHNDSRTLHGLDRDREAKEENEKEYGPIGFSGKEEILLVCFCVQREGGTGQQNVWNERASA